MISPSPITFTKRMEENKMNYYLGFDAGTQSVKVAVYDEDRSEERRVGKECRSRWSPYH